MYYKDCEPVFSQSSARKELNSSKRQGNRTSESNEIMERDNGTTGEWELGNGGMEEWRNGGMEEWRNGGMDG